MITNGEKGCRGSVSGSGSSATMNRLLDEENMLGARPISVITAVVTSV
jgi:hypothetical protein